MSIFRKKLSTVTLFALIRKLRSISTNIIDNWNICAQLEPVDQSDSQGKKSAQSGTVKKSSMRPFQRTGSASMSNKRTPQIISLAWRVINEKCFAKHLIHLSIAWLVGKSPLLAVLLLRWQNWFRFYVHSFCRHYVNSAEQQRKKCSHRNTDSPFFPACDFGSPHLYQQSTGKHLQPRRTS